MCLYISNKKGHIAKHDIICYKRLDKTNEGNYITPCQEWPVVLDSILIPDEEEPNISSYGYKWQITDGVIHAYLNPNPRIGDGKYIFKAIIPRGTRFWIQDDMKQIAAEKLELTSEILENDSDSIKFDYSIFIDHAADVRLKGGNRVKMSKDISLDDIEGIYAFDEQCIAPIFLKTEFSVNPLDNYPEKEMVSFYSCEDAEKQLNGEQLSAVLEQYCNKSNLLALDFCRKNNSYLPSEGELIKAVKNLGAINITMKLLGQAQFPFGWYWSSSIYNSEEVWGPYCDGLWSQWEHSSYCCPCRVIPFLK